MRVPVFLHPDISSGISGFGIKGPRRTAAYMIAPPFGSGIIVSSVILRRLRGSGVFVGVSTHCGAWMAYGCFFSDR